MFALKIWPWPSPNWWITGASKTSSQGACADQGDDLDVKMKKEFQGFLLIDMGMLTEDWSQPDFKREVFFLFYFHRITTDGQLEVPGRGKGVPI